MSNISNQSKEEASTEEILWSISSGEDPPMSEWSSLEIAMVVENRKNLLQAQGLYSPGSGEICTKYISMSNHDLLKHIYYRYPAVTDPGIVEALLSTERPVMYSDDGADLYLTICSEMNMCPVKKFHRNLLSQEIDLSYYSVNPAGVRAMAIALQCNKNVLCFNLTENFLSDDACYHLGQLLHTNDTLKELILAGCRIGVTGLTRLIEHLNVNKVLQTLDLSRNCLGDDGGTVFAKHIAYGVTVPRINLSRNDLGRQTSLALAAALEFKNKLTYLDLSWNNFFVSITTSKMLNILSKSMVLREINLAWNSMEGEKIAESISNIICIPSIQIINLSNNRFRGEDVTIIVSSLFKAKKLNTLNLSYNPLSPDDTVTVIEKMLRPRVKVQKMLLEGIPVNNKFVLTLERVTKMKCRVNFSVSYGKVLQNWTIEGPDSREVILNRAVYLGQKDKKHRVDIALFFLKLNKEYKTFIQIKSLQDIIDAEGVPLDQDLVAELANVFPGPKSAKLKSINLQNVCDYVYRMWPDKKLPPTTSPEPGSLPIPPVQKGKGKETK